MRREKEGEGIGRGGEGRKGRKGRGKDGIGMFRLGIKKPGYGPACIQCTHGDVGITKKLIDFRQQI